MDFVKAWMLTIIGVTILSTLIEILLPETEIKKYPRLVIGLIMMIVIVQPISKIREIDVFKEEYKFAADTAVKSRAEEIEAVEWRQIEIEFSNRIHESIMKRLGIGYENVRISITLCSSGIDTVVIENANEEQKKVIKNVLEAEYGINTISA